MDRMTPEQAAALLGRMDDLTAKLNVAEEQVEQTHRLAKRLRLAIYALAVMLVLIGGGALELRSQQAEIQASREQQCENGNLTRAGQRAIWEFYFEVSSAGGKAQGSPQSVLDFYDDYLAWIKTEVLPDRDCSDLGKEYPKPGPPPDFQKALKEALAEEGDG